MTTTNLTADTQTAIESLETIEYLANHVVALGTIILYWTLIALVAASINAVKLAPGTWNLLTAWVSDQLGHTTGFFVSEVARMSVEPTVVADVTTVVSAQPVVATIVATVTPAPVKSMPTMTECAPSVAAAEFNALFYNTPATKTRTIAQLIKQEVAAYQPDMSDAHMLIPCQVKTEYSKNKPGRKSARPVIQSTGDLLD